MNDLERLQKNQTALKYALGWVGHYTGCHGRWNVAFSTFDGCDCKRSELLQVARETEEYLKTTTERATGGDKK